jgi:hypothetical protein
MKRLKPNNKLKETFIEFLKEHKALEEFKDLILNPVSKKGVQTTFEEFLQINDPYEWVLSGFTFAKASFRKTDWVHVCVLWRKKFQQGELHSKLYTFKTYENKKNC